MDVKDSHGANDTGGTFEDYTQKVSDLQEARGTSAQTRRSTTFELDDLEATAVFGQASYARGARRGGRSRYTSVHRQHSSARTDARYMPTEVSYNTRSASASTKVPYRTIFVVLGIVIVMIAAIYGAGVYAFSERFYPNTFIGAIDISFLTQDQAAEAIEEAVSNYEISVEGEGLEFTLTAADGGISVDASSVAEQAAQDKDPWFWFLQIWDTNDKTSFLVASSDEGVLGELVREQVDAFNADASASEDAFITYSLNSGAYVIQDEVYGGQISADAVIEAVIEAIATMESTVQITDDMLILPEVFSTDERLTAGVESANSMLSCDVVLTSSLMGIEMGELDGSTISDWISFDDSYSPVLDEEAVSAWVSDLVSVYNTVGTTRTYTRGDGEEVTAEGGNYGWTVDSETLVAAVNAAIANGEQGDIEVTFSQEGNGYTAVGMDWGAYCDIDLSEQHAYYYDASGNLLWDSGIVSGLPEDDRDTPTGIYYLNSKQENVTLIGVADENGDPSYETPVDYWMPFVDNMVGLHDASWQPTWVFSDSTAYKTYGSHGCVNLPVSAAAELFEIIQIGDVVIVHW